MTNRFLSVEDDQWANVGSAFSNGYLNASAARQTRDRQKTDDKGSVGAKTSSSLNKSSTDARQTTAADGRQTGGNLVELVKTFEGFSPTPYDDYGHSSIGYGTYAKDGDSEINEAQASERLAEELSNHRARVINHASKYGYKFSDHQLDALTSFDYNTGALEKLTAGGKRTVDQIAEKLPEYNKAGGKPLRGLTTRRLTEQELFLKGYQQ